jgi:alpha-methylacyl-CoA racemase
MSSLYEQAVQKGSPKGKVLDCSMVEGSAYLSSWLWSSRSIPGLWEGTARGTNILDGGLPQYDTYETRDNKFMSVGALEPAFYKQLLKGKNKRIRIRKLSSIF